MSVIAFIDTEVSPSTRKVMDIGGIRSDGGRFHSASLAAFADFLQGADYVCGHNILSHDLKYVGDTVASAGIEAGNVIDTLFLSPLLFPKRPYHRLVKDDKLQTEELNNPYNDSVKSMDLFADELNAYDRLPGELREIFRVLLSGTREFHGFFNYHDNGGQNAGGWLSKIGKSIRASSNDVRLQRLISTYFHGKICENADITIEAKKSPVSLAYALALIDTISPDDTSRSLTPPWVMKSYPEVEHLMAKLRNTPCLKGCDYCRHATDIHGALRRFFGFETFRTYAGKPLQENAVKAAVEGRSLLAVFPTGGGKSLTFQLPALIAGQTVH